MGRKTRDAIEPEVKEKVIAAAKKILADYHPDKLTMDMIARETGLAKGTLYNYFKDKDSVISFIFANSHEPYMERAARIVASNVSALEKLRRYAELSIKMSMESRELTGVLSQSSTTSNWRPSKKMAQTHRHSIELLREILKEGLREGIFGDFSVDELVLTVWGILSSIGSHLLESGRKISISEGTANIMAILLNGVARKQSA